jgi:PAS domain S-box-containing protein
MVELTHAGLGQTARAERRAESMLHSYIRDPQAPQFDEVQHLIAEIASQQLQLEAENEELRTVQQRLEAYRDRYIDLYDFAPLGYVTLDEDGYVQEINLAGAKLLSADRDALIGYPFTAYVDREDAKVFLGHVRECLREHREAVCELNLAATGDQSLVVQLRSIPLDDPQTEVALCKTAMTDITERKCMERRLARLNHCKEQLLGPGTLGEKLKLITDVVVDLFGADFARIWVIAEGDLCKTGCSHATATEGPCVCRDRTRCLHLVASSGRYTHLDGGHCRVPLGCYKIGRVASGAEPKFVTNDVTHDPRVHDHGWAASLGLVSFAGYRLLLPDGAPLGVLAAFSKRPISALDEAFLEDLANTASQVIRTGMAEETLRREKAFADIVIDGIPGLFYVLDSQGRFVRWNRAEEELTGLSPEELRGMEGLLTIVQDDRELVAGKIREVFEKGNAEVETRVIAKDGVRHFLCTGRRLDVGQSAYLVGSGVDITERKRVEEEVRQAQQRALELQLREKAHVEAELNKVRDVLVRQTRLATVGQLSASIAHELRNPLGAIRNTLFLIRRKTCPEASQCRHYLEIIEGEVVAASQIITECTALSQGKPPAKSPVALAAIVAKARAQVDALNAIQWHCVFTPEPFVVHADAAQLEQVFRNLFFNAIQAMGGSGAITVEAMRSQQYDDILVGDSGPGIPVELRDQVFEPLVTTKTGGTGLGLSICRQIIEQHGGAIELLVSDKPGTIFQIRLPATEG